MKGVTAPLPFDSTSTSRPASPGFSINQARRTPPSVDPRGNRPALPTPGGRHDRRDKREQGRLTRNGSIPGASSGRKAPARNERKGPLMDVGQGPPRIQGLLGHPEDAGGAWNALMFVVQTGTQGRPGSRDSSPRHARGPVPTNLIGRLRGEAPPR